MSQPSRGLEIEECYGGGCVNQARELRPASVIIHFAEIQVRSHSPRQTHYWEVKLASRFLWVFEDSLGGDGSPLAF